MKLFMITIAVSLGGYASAHPLNGTTCQGRSVYWENVSHMGGPGVGPDGIVSHSELRIRGKVVEHINQTVHGPSSKPVYTVTFDQKTKKALQSSGGPVSGWQIYSIFMEVTRQGSLGHFHILEQVVCRKSWAMLP